MLGKLTGFELKKSTGSKFFRIVLCLMLVLNLLLMCGLREFMSYQEAIRNGTALGYEPEIHDYFFRTAASQRQMTDSIRRDYGLLASLTPEETAAFEAAMLEKYGADIFDFFALPPPEADQLPGYFGEDIPDSSMISWYKQLHGQNQDIQEGLDSVVRAAKAFGREALEKGDSYGIRRNQQIIRLYSAPREPVRYHIWGWQDYLLESPTMLLVFLMVLLASAGSFTGERDKQTWLLLHTARNGKGKNLAAKYLSGILTAALLTLLFQAVSFGATAFKCGFLGVNEPVTARQDLALCPWTLTIGQYALIELGCQMLAAMLLSVLLNTVSALSKSSVVAYGAGTILLGIGLLPVFLPPKSLWLAGPLSLAKPIAYFSTYNTGNFFGFPVLWVVIQAVLWTALSIGCVFLANRVYHRKRGAV